MAAGHRIIALSASDDMIIIARVTITVTQSQVLRQQSTFLE